MHLPAWKNLLRFRLRTLLVVITAAAVWLGFHVNSARLQQKSVAAIRKYGGWVRYDFQFPSGEYWFNDFDNKASSWVPEWLLEQFGIDMFHSVVQVNLNYSEDSGSRQENHNPSDEALQYLPGLPNLRVLFLSDSQATDASMTHLAALYKLEYLMMWDVHHVSDIGVANLKSLKNLRYILLSNSRITDKSLEVFSTLPKLDGLSLQFGNFTDAGLKSIARLSNLTTLLVCGKEDGPNSISDAGLKQLHSLTRLKTLGVQNTEVTSMGVSWIKEAIPGVEVLTHPEIAN